MLTLVLELDSRLLIDINNTATDIERRSRNSYTAPCKCVVSHGALIGGIRVFADHTCGNEHKQNTSTTFVRRWRFTHVYLHAQTAIHMHLMNHGYFDCGKNPEYPQSEPHARIKMVQVVGSPVCICDYSTQSFVRSL